MSRDALDLHSLDLVEVRRNGKVIAEFYVEPEQQANIEKAVSTLEHDLTPTPCAQRSNVLQLKVVK